MSVIYWDTMLFVYWLEENPVFQARVQEIHETMTRRGDRLCTSVFTAGEVLAGPRKRNQPDVVAQVLDYFQSGEIEVLPFDLATANTYSMIRTDHRVLPADAIHLATAAEAKVDLFLTNDHKLQSLHVPGIRFIGGLEGKVI
uniref:PIN domain-containing protein n=1 Tax=Acidobacterium capsulatum TaxID=33075 RepID=A0A7V4XUJ3_9BACT